MGKSRYSKDFRNEVRKTDLVKKVKDLRYKFNRKEDITAVLSDIYETYDYLQIDCANRIMRSYYDKISRIKKRFKKMIEKSSEFEGILLFLTLTINDDNYYRDIKTWRKILRTFLKERYIDYVANFDYGEEDGRLHFHAVVLSPKSNYQLDSWLKYGFYFYEVIKVNNVSIDKIRRYLTKLTCHALKDSTKDNLLIYGRSKNG